MIIHDNPWKSMIIYDNPWYPHSIPSEVPLSACRHAHGGRHPHGRRDDAPLLRRRQIATWGPMTGPRTGQRGGRLDDFPYGKWALPRILPWKMGLSMIFAMKNGGVGGI